jgi:signal transduction histidine kinase
VRNRKFIILFVAFALVSLASFTLLFFVPSLVTYRLSTAPPINKAQKILIERSKIGLELTSDLMEVTLKSDSKGAFTQLTKGFGKVLQNDGLAVFLFRNNEMIFWSENYNVVNIPEESGKLVFVQNVWCITYWLAGEDLKGLLLVKVKYEYPFQNQFLKNEYHQSISFLENFRISPTIIMGAFPINLIGPKPVFYLSHIPQFFDNECNKLTSKIKWLGFAFLLASIYILFWSHYFRRWGLFSTLILTVLLSSIRLAALYWQWLPQEGWPLFGPEVFAYSWVNPSLGDFFINAIIVFALASYAYRNLSFGLRKRDKWVNIILVLLFGAANFSLFFLIDNLFSTLVRNSTIVLEAYKIFDLSSYSVIGYLSISLWFATCILVLHGTLNQMVRAKRQTVIRFIPVSFIVVVGIFALFDAIPTIYGIGASIVLAVTMIFYFGRTKNFPTGFFLILVSAFSLYSVLLVSHIAEEKDRNIRKVLAINLSNERDPIAEVLFPSIAKRLHADNEVIHYLENIAKNEQNLYNHLNEQYLGGYFKKYDFQVTVCLYTSNLIIEKTGEVIRCYDFFEEMINDFGLRIPGTSFFHLSNQNGRISYLGMIEYVLSDGSEICIYLELDTKISRDLLGYPELLLEGKFAGRSIIDNYSSAKYNNNQLIARTGSFNYPLINQLPVDSTNRYTFYNQGGFNHLIFNSEGGIVIVLSRPTISLFNVTASFAWVFLFFYITLLLLTKLGRMPIDLSTTIPSFKNRIQRALVQMLLLSLILVGIVTIVYNVQSFKRKNHQNLMEKLSSAMVEIENNLVNENLINAEYSDYITFYLVHLSNVFYSDINLYDSSGVLLTSSRPEIFDRKLLGNIMNPIAWNEMALNHKARIIHTEKIGSMSYLSAYVPLLNSQNEKVAYLNLPYFTRQSEFIREVFTVIVALINIYALLILFTLFLAILISNQISKPLELIREKLRKIDITKHNEPINYEGEDEIGRLVKEYNRMIVELAERAHMLAQSQRQSAWREMAKQVAHEIKNPLTPIKLNLQHLMKAKQENQPNWEQLFDNFAQTLIEQINTLSTIATEFSNFAKMPIGSFQKVNLCKVIDYAINLFSGYPNIKIESTFSGSDNFFVLADKEQLQRVFVNLIKNSIQAIDRNLEGVIKVSYSQSVTHITVIIQDNGCGISPDTQEKLFSPNFTTKSGGMGLGLAISKGIIEAVGGKIWFETEEGRGSKFFIELQKHKGEK